MWNIVGYSGIQKGTVGTVGYNMGDTMSVWGRTTSIPCMHSPTTKERFFNCRRIKLKRDQSKQNRAHRGCGWIKMSSQTFDQLSSLSSQLPFVGMEQCYKAGWDALQVSFLDATTATFRQLFEQSKIFYLIYTEYYTVPLCISSVVLYHVNNK